MDVCKEPRMFLVLALLFLGPGRRITARLQDVKCIVFNEDFMTCKWDSSQNPGANYFLYYRYSQNPMAECEHYLQSDGVNTGCWFNRSQIDLNRSFNVYVNISNSGGSLNRTMFLVTLVKPNPPVNLTIRSLRNNQLQLTWGSTYKRPRCLEHMVEYRSNTDTEWKKSKTEQMEIIIPSVDPEKFYTFYVSSKMNDKCADSDIWSEPAGPASWGGNTTSKGSADEVKSMWFWILNILIPIGSILVLVLIFLLLTHRVERIWLVLMPRIPNPSNKFGELFTDYQGNFSEWAGVPKDAVESFKPSYRENICRVTELLPGGGYLPLSNDILDKVGVVPGISVDRVPKINIE